MIKEKKGIAIEYNSDLPQIIAIARGILFDKLIEIALENNITIYEDPDLAEVLSQLDVGSEIPEDLFTAISEVLAYCYKINSTFKNKIDSMEIL